jgi:uncharacterized protein GlcG (DUF336 family)
MLHARRLELKAQAAGLIARFGFATAREGRCPLTLPEVFFPREEADMAEITLRKARSIVRKAIGAARELGLQPLSVVVLDAGGHVIAFEREDGASPGRFAIAHGKALRFGHAGYRGHGAARPGRGAALFHRGGERALRRALMPVPGGASGARPQGTVLGAVGVTGDTSENDAAVAVAGIEAAGLHRRGVMRQMAPEQPPEIRAQALVRRLPLFRCHNRSVTIYMLQASWCANETQTHAYHEPAHRRHHRQQPC